MAYVKSSPERSMPTAVAPYSLSLSVRALTCRLERIHHLTGINLADPRGPLPERLPDLRSKSLHRTHTALG
ncbi:hypothetical protein GUY60_02085 [Streptomyces sp. YC537]|uniref:Uncharacterized protein n=1 Tax=Streptomyces boluensis TaxID=1775135 RepID=A0A964UR68_9ACTN|nr:hypothetical protein [Streptomyces boluensis]